MTGKVILEGKKYQIVRVPGNSTLSPSLYPHPWQECFDPCSESLRMWHSPQQLVQSSLSYYLPLCVQPGGIFKIPCIDFISYSLYPLFPGPAVLTLRNESPFSLQLIRSFSIYPHFLQGASNTSSPSSSLPHSVPKHQYHKPPNLDRWCLAG